MAEWTILDNCTQAILADGSSYWPERWSIEALHSRKAELDSVNLRAWSSEYMNVILPPETQMFDPEAWPTWMMLLPSLVYVQAWDLAISEAETADYTVGGCLGWNQETSDLYIVDVRRGRWNFNATQDEIARLGAAWSPLLAVGIESVQYQQAAVQEALRRTLLPVVPLQARSTRSGNVGTEAGMERIMNPALAGLGNDKVSRARQFEARANAGKVFRPAAPVPWWPAVANELAFFPSGEHDDVVDMLAYATMLTTRLSTGGGMQTSSRRLTPSRGF